MELMPYLQIREARLPGKGVGVGSGATSLLSACPFVVTRLQPGTYVVTPGQSAAPPPWIEEAGKGGEERRQAGLAGSSGQCQA